MLAPATRGEGLGLWVRGPDFYLFPIDPRSGRMDAPLVTSARELSAMPVPCAPNEDGYVVADALSIEPGIRLLSSEGGEGAGVNNGSEARLVVSPSRVCIDALAAAAGSPPSLLTALDPGRAERERLRRAAERSRLRLKATAEPGSAPEGPGARLVVNGPDGERRGYRCRD